MSAREKIAAALNKLADNLGLADGEERPIEPGDGIADYTVRDMDKIANAAERLSEYTGGGGGSNDMFFVVHNGNIVDGEDCLDKTGQEILDAYLSGKIIIATVYIDPFNQQLPNNIVTDSCYVMYQDGDDYPYLSVWGNGTTQRRVNICYQTGDGGLSDYPAFVDQG